MSYRAKQTVQITEKGESSSSLVVHEMSKDGRPICGTGGDVPRPWRGVTMMFTPQGPGAVTCARCAVKTS